MRRLGLVSTAWPSIIVRDNSRPTRKSSVAPWLEHQPHLSLPDPVNRRDRRHDTATCPGANGRVQLSPALPIIEKIAAHSFTHPKVDWPCRTIPRDDSL